ncbi:RNA polymerase sigma-70 factor (ECF subfamily) [Pseudobacter ginsenosidimutans]|uniref:RNA polymerase sigma-70 factor (ECF subfamily) n=1 Tax=Pseudobacter ginsenosidimutans TaxID=661488 RepID=A0A4Q7MQ77_9BACT|nr:sigma-70 family RNA polymerase sigma factor [Pseudobacter ginsenosidimutans]RZS70862.1 RNA polymerase sigma-70 factor (ECF subfamily) [Pseudobacter ginsenosidimutans]
MLHSTLYDEKLTLQNIAEGDQDAFYELYKQYVDQLRNYIRRVTADELAADGILQEIFLRVWLNRDELTELNSFKAWIFTIAANETMRFLRKKITYRQLLLKSSIASPAQQAITPDLEYDMVELRRLIQLAVDRLSPQRRLIFSMSREQGMKPAKIAAELDLSISTVKNSLSTALKEIRSYLRDAGIVINILVILNILFKKM